MVDPVSLQAVGQNGFTPGGFAASFRAESDPSDWSSGLIPHMGEFIKDSSGRTLLYQSEDEARDAAAAEIRKRLRII